MSFCVGCVPHINSHFAPKSDEYARRFMNGSIMELPDNGDLFVAVVIMDKSFPRCCMLRLGRLGRALRRLGS
jgi:hypothetical protein